MRTLTHHRAGGLALLGLMLSTAPLSAGSYVVGPMAMKPGKVGPDTDFVISYAAGLFNYTAPTACFTTGVNLPDGVTVTRVTVIYASGAATNPVVSLLRKPLVSLGGDDSEELAGDMLADDSGMRKKTELPLNGSVTTIDNRSYSYGFGICLGGGGSDIFYAARITYASQP